MVGCSVQQQLSLINLYINRVMEELKPKDSSVNANYALQVNKLKAQIRVRFVPKNMQMTESQLLQW